MSRGRPLTALERLREQRRSLGDGTLDGRSRLAQPYYLSPRGGRGGFATADVGGSGGVGSQGGAGEIPEGEDTVDVAHLLGVTPETVLVTARVACEVLGVVDEGPSTFTVERCDGYGGGALPFFWRAWPPKLVLPPPPPLVAISTWTTDPGAGVQMWNVNTKQVDPGWEEPDAGGWKGAWHPSGWLFALPLQHSPFLAVFDVATKTIDSDWPGLVDWGRAAAWSPDGTRLALVHHTSPFLTVIDVATKTVESGWPSLAGNGSDVAWSPDGQWLATGHDGGSHLTVIDVETKTIDSGWPSLDGHSTNAPVAWSPDGQWLATGQDSPWWSAVIDVETKTIDSGWPVSPGFVYAIAWSNAGDRLAYGHAAAPNRLTVIDVATKTVESGWPSVGDFAGIRAVAWSGDDLLLFLTNSQSSSPTVVNTATKTTDTGWPSLPFGSMPGVSVAPDPGNVTSG